MENIASKFNYTIITVGKQNISWWLSSSTKLYNLQTTDGKNKMPGRFVWKIRPSSIGGGLCLDAERRNKGNLFNLFKSSC